MTKQRVTNLYDLTLLLLKRDKKYVAACSLLLVETLWLEKARFSLFKKEERDDGKPLLGEI